MGAENVRDLICAEKIRPCLIGGFAECGSIAGVMRLLRCPTTKALPESSSGVPRYYPLCLPNGSICSLDMVRIRLVLNGNDEDVACMEGRVQSFQSDTYAQYDSLRSVPGHYAHLYTLGFGDSSVSLGVGQFLKGAKADMNRGFLEFNPNKVGHDGRFWRFLDIVGASVKHADLVRYDFAVDIPVARYTVRTRKDRRKYAYEQGATLTEYLGIRNSVGRVKVYDKGAELGVKGMVLTRVELTCGGLWTTEQIRAHWPTIFQVKDDEKALGLMSTFASALCELIDDGLSVEKYLGALDHHTRKKVRELIEGVTYPLPDAGSVYVLSAALGWAAYLERPQD